MRSLLVMTTLLFLALPASGQKLDIDTNTPEGQLLEKIGTEEDLAKKAELLGQFAQQYPKHEAAGWVYGQLSTTYAKLNQPEKALEAGEKLLELEPANAEGAHAMLKIAEAAEEPGPDQEVGRADAWRREENSRGAGAEV